MSSIKNAAGQSMTGAELGVVLIAHGSRRAEANEELLAIADLLRQAGFRNVEPSYLEIAEPTIVSAAQTCIARGAATVVLTPYFLSAGRHVVSDLEAFRARLGQENLAVDFRLAQPFGPDPLLAKILIARITQSLPVAPAQVD